MGLKKEEEVVVGVGEEQPGVLQHCSSAWPGKRRGRVVAGPCEMDQMAWPGSGGLGELAREVGAVTLYCLHSLGEAGEQDC